MSISEFEKNYIRYVDILKALVNGEDINNYYGAVKDALNSLRVIFPADIDLVVKWINSEFRVMCKADTEIQVVRFSESFLELYRYSLFKFDLITEILRERAVSNLGVTEELKQVFACMENGEINTDALNAFVPFLFYLPADEEVFELVKRGLLLYDKWDDENNTVVLNLLVASDAVFQEELSSWIRANIENEYVRLIARAN